MKKTYSLPVHLFSFLTIIVLAVTAWTYRPSTVRAATQEPDRIATGVVEFKAVAATLTADAPFVDRIATGVMEAKAIAATLTASGPNPMATCKPDIATTAGVTATTGVSSGATKHCMAKSGFSAIELRNITPNVKSLNLFVDGVQVESVDYGRYGCIYLTTGTHVFQWKNDSEKKQSNARSFPVNGPDGWYSNSKRSDGIRNPYDAWLDPYEPTQTATVTPTKTPIP